VSGFDPRLPFETLKKPDKVMQRIESIPQRQKQKTPLEIAMILYTFGQFNLGGKSKEILRKEPSDKECFSYFAANPQTMLISSNPYTREVIATYDVHSDKVTDDKINHCHQAFNELKLMNPDQKAALFQNLAISLENKKNDLARLITYEMGKPISESISEIEKCIWLCRHYSSTINFLIPQDTIETDQQITHIVYEPLGVIFAIMPWNFPFWQVFRFAIPNLAAGNSCLLKHAPNVTGCAISIQNLIAEVGFPEGTFISLQIDLQQVEQVISNSKVRGVSLTGSAVAGKSVASLAGKHLKKCVLELGGSDPFIVFADAEIEKSCFTGLRSRMLNAGQVCIAAKRFIVQDSVFDKFTECFVEQAKGIILGDPLLKTTTMGPLARMDLVEQVERQVNVSVEMGARVLLGAKRWRMHTGFYEPTILTEVTTSMPVFAEETFGPVAVIIPFKDVDEAIGIANESPFGLGAGLWTSDMEKAKYAAARIEAGAVFTNSMVRSDPRLPFGGSKSSGFGRELHLIGMKEFMNVKTIQFTS